jgi:hypothetical protein
MLATCSKQLTCLAYSSTLKMEATCSSETSVDFQRTTLRYISQGIILNNHCYENLKTGEGALLTFFWHSPLRNQ